MTSHAVPGELPVTGYDGVGDALVRAVYLGPDLGAGILSHALDLMEPAEPDQHQCDEIKHPVLGRGRHGCVQIMDHLGSFSLSGVHLSGQCFFNSRFACCIDPGSGEIDNGNFNARAQFGELHEPHALTSEIDGCDVCHRIGTGCHDEQPSTWSASHARDLMMLEQAHCFAQQGPADPFSLDEFSFGSYQITWFHALSDDGDGDIAGDRLGALPVVRGVEEHLIGQESPG